MLPFTVNKDIYITPTDREMIGKTDAFFHLLQPSVSRMNQWTFPGRVPLKS